MSITHSSIVDAPIDGVFSWFERPGAFARLSPPWQPTRLRQESPSLKDGEAVLALPGGLSWVAEHDADAYDPPFRFADEVTRRGIASLPVASLVRWRHTHEFAVAGPSLTRVTARVETQVGS